MLIRLSSIVQALTKQQPHAQDDEFQKQPKLTVTEVSGGDGYAVVPSKAVIKVDMRLTPAFNEAAADKHPQYRRAERQEKQSAGPARRRSRKFQPSRRS